MERAPWKEIRDAPRDYVDAKYLPTGFHFDEPSRYKYEESLKLLRFWQQRKIDGPDEPVFRLRAWRCTTNKKGESIRDEPEYGSREERMSEPKTTRNKRNRSGKGAAEEPRAGDDDDTAEEGVAAGGSPRPRKTKLSLKAKGKQKAQQNRSESPPASGTPPRSDREIVRILAKRVDASDTEDSDGERAAFERVEGGPPSCARTPLERHAFLKSLSEDRAYGQCVEIATKYTVS